MQRLPFGNLIWESLLAVSNIVIALISLSATIIAFFIVPNETVIQVRFAMIVFMACFFITIIALRTAWLAYQLSNSPSPKVIYVKDAPKPYCDCHALLVVDPTLLLSNDAIVSIYYLESFEKYVGLGKVINVQDDKRIQIVVTHNYNFEDKLNKIMSNSKEELERLVIKTSIPSFILQGGLNEDI